MDEAGAKTWLTENLDVSRETLARLEDYVAMLLAESERQNLIARSTFDIVWSRHILDSAQLLAIAPARLRDGHWLDLGSGPGLPGMVLALLSDIKIRLVESRARRIAFLEHCISELGLQDRVIVEGARLETIEERSVDAITARAFAPLPKLVALAVRFARPDTLWILPKGKSVEDELAAVRTSWQGDFETVQSATDPESSIVVARDVQPRRKRT